MRANAVALYDQFLGVDKKLFIVPVYQRNYDWTLSQCNRLFMDIIKAHKQGKKHFTGSIVYKFYRYGGSAGPMELLIIDGQQRITTISLLLKAIYDVAQENALPVEDSLVSSVCNSTEMKSCYSKMQPVAADAQQYGYLLDNKVECMDIESHIYQNYMHFKNELLQYLKENHTLDDVMDGIKQLEIVEIGLDDTDSAQEIFANINATGLPLTLSDLIRNYLLMDDEDQNRLYETYWIEIERMVTYDKLSDFMIPTIHYLVEGRFNDSDAYDKFTQHCDKNVLENEEVLKVLQRTASYYALYEGNNYGFSQAIADRVQRFNKIHQATVLPFIFKILDDYILEHITEDTLCEILDVAFTYVLRYLICRGSRGLSKEMKGLYGKALAGSYEDYVERFIYYLTKSSSTSRMPSDKECTESLLRQSLYKNTHLCQFVLLAIENDGKEKLDTTNLTIEHILPQSRNSKDWRLDLGDAFEDIHDRYLHTLGNLTLTGYNSELSNKSFAKKKEDLRQYSKANILNQDILEASIWDEEAIMNRAHRLTEILLKQFPYRTTDYEIESDAYNVALSEDAFDYEGKKPSFFIYDGMRFPVTSWKSLYKKTMDIFFETNPDALLTLAVNETSAQFHMAIENTPAALAMESPHNIRGSSIVFDIPSEANEVLKRIRHLFTTLGLSMDDYVIILRNKETQAMEQYHQFWTQFYKLVEQRQAWTDRMYTKYSDIHVKIGTSQAYIKLNLVNKNNRIRIELRIPDNKELFDQLYEKANEIEAAVGFNLIWDRKNNRQGASIEHHILGLDFNDHSNYDALMNELIDKTLQMKKVLQQYIL